MKIMTILASNSRKSINRTLLSVVSDKINTQPLTHLEVGDYSMPIYSSDIEEEQGFPDTVKQVKALFDKHDAFIIACPEHNGTMPAVFKNFIDWLSRINDDSIFAKKPVLLLSTSPGPRGGATNLQNLVNIMPYWGADIRDSLSLGSFYNNFAYGRFSTEHDKTLTAVVHKFVNGL